MGIPPRASHRRLHGVSFYFPPERKYGFLLCAPDVLYVDVAGAMAPKGKTDETPREGDGSEYSYITDEEATWAEPAAEPPTRGGPGRMTASKSKAVKKEKDERSSSDRGQIGRASCRERV